MYAYQIFNTKDQNNMISFIPIINSGFSDGYCKVNNDKIELDVELPDLLLSRKLYLFGTCTSLKHLVDKELIISCTYSDKKLGNESVRIREDLRGLLYINVPLNVHHISKK